MPEAEPSPYPEIPATAVADDVREMQPPWPWRWRIPTDPPPA
jgi:hypothetical protein